ncbi:bifunctional 23S rRNA (guanine(2069)-N(7))-methyltransferase RlmK/23S rRNA (guanine(2445)-N(2))-methyltransferase RlmL [Adlercreutzia caecimuris]|uniref:bifunctional 23S rRNA (guanine(2069)-N(7))-methyltransferase RlmK/23S rRNA (guanine(2445)-N(2))-methyltransferase RlmL n=1 Tax=Adlercreutzia caecimuris TaxID=671266 RepID=UPI0013727E08|nr:bifunctional 23S rRNA (guanine(2069)-N(7))-methyltransferase RlmK/23S rRNA (guanine(2445)-N(2))-methyltransferase RlmL [Adlercreutzia caecimuris]NBJ67603.1 bifunctional 23S rRNA (guanine(2069)-N(7))-methyltransferase RlmK/23S rRNA (guanine(2445)-N(2))-methyltransferase RlmL [Adlercreutzia caecimuris]
MGESRDTRFEDCEFFATCPPGVEGLLADELRGLGVRKVRPLAGGAAFYGKPAAGLRVCLWSRLAGRVNTVVGRVDARDGEALYAGVRELVWEDEIALGASIAVRAHGTNDELRNTQFTALKVKDALCDRLVEARGSRPDVDAGRPDALIEVRLKGARATVSLDLSGRSLSRRSYLDASDGADAPVAVAQAAALLAALDAGALLAEGWGLIDPAADDGILVCEAAAMLVDQAPGLVRDRWGFSGWARTDAEAWDDMLAEADNRLEAGLVRLLGAERAAHAASEAPDQESVTIVGLSESSPAIARARQHLRAAGLRAVASVEAASGDAAAVERRLGAVVARAAREGAALVVANAAPPSRDDDARAVAEQAACVAAARRAPAGSRFGFAGSGAFASRFGAAPEKRFALGVGRTEAVVEIFAVPPREPAVILVPNPAGGTELSVEVNDAGVAQFAARLRKVARERRKWAAREGVACYRLYDGDLPEYACAIDLYEGAAESEGILYAHVAEYAAPKSVDEALARARFEDVLAVVPAVLGIRPDHVFSKARVRARGGGQYRDAGGRSYVTHTSEDGLICEIDLGGYLDTGIFLDHRTTREMVGKMAAGKRFLNLFAYTGVATLHAAAGGASSTTTVDLSQTYLDWAARNMEANGFPAVLTAERDGRGAAGRRGGANRRPRHELVRADAVRWIQEARRERRQWDLIFVDPPTFSNSKAMGRRTWDVQRDHAELLIGVSRLLAKDGVAVFSCNLRAFKPDTEALARAGVKIEDITASTIPHDFERNPRIHHCYLVRRAVSAEAGADA